MKSRVSNRARSGGRVVKGRGGWDEREKEGRGEGGGGLEGLETERGI